MCTVRCIARQDGGVYPSMHWAGLCIPAFTGHGGVCPGGVCPGGVCRGGCLPGEVSEQGGGVYPSMHWVPPYEHNAWQTPVKTLPCCNFVVDGNKNAFQ